MSTYTAETATPSAMRAALLEQLRHTVNARADVLMGALEARTSIPAGLTVAGHDEIRAIGAAVESIDRVYRAELAGGAPQTVDVEKLIGVAANAAAETGATMDVVDAVSSALREAVKR